jgi:ribonucleoside-triphosphate reductase (thioredoxin)
MYQDTRGLLSQVKFYDSYSRFNEALGRYETWEESVERVMNMHRQFYASKMTGELSEAIDFAENLYKKKAVIGSQRALQFGGEQLLKHQLKMYNCFKKDTPFVTSCGIKTFENFQEGDVITVLTHTGSWKKATVKSFGQQELYAITLSNGGSKVIYATKNHRWLLADGTETTSLKVGDRIRKEPSIFKDFEWETASPEEQLYWCYGMVFGDGTVNGRHSMLRLCGRDSKYESRFLTMGFKSSSSLSLKGDIIVYTGKYKKTLPNPEIDSPELIRAFVRGYLDADGNKNNNAEGKRFTGIQSSNKDAIEFIRKCFPIAGVNIRSEKEFTGQETNYGIRPYTVYFSTNDHSGSKYNSGWKVQSIEYHSKEVVWCLEVEDDHSFVLEGGILTGNCLSSYADRPEFFGEYFYSLLCGCGMGFSVQYHHIQKLPNVVQRTKQPKTHVVEDSIEGWAEALDVLLSSFFEGGGKHPEFEGRRVYFDLSKIRPKGAPISGGFKAPGPDALRIALDRIEYLIQGLVLKEKTSRLRSIDVYDICMFVADSVISGGVRRSATICLFSPEDELMAKAKTGNWFKENPQRGRSNNSALILRNSISKEKFHELMVNIKQFGEPGFVFADSSDMLVNPCVEIGMYPRLGDKTGIQGCNLSEINGSACKTVLDFDRACHAAAILGTLQAGYTDFKFVTEETKEIFRREALLGVSITGWMSNPDLLFDEKVLREGANVVKETNKKIASLIGINQAARTTCTKPSGSASIILETSSGIHPEHSPMYIRHVQLNKQNEIAQLIKKTNPHMVEDSVWSTNQTDYVVGFPIIADKDSLFKSTIHGTKHLDYVKKAQENWVEYGTNVELCIEPSVRHNISNTIVVHDWDEVEEYIFENQKYFSGIALIAPTGDKDYFQAPNTEILTGKEIVKKYGTGSIFASGLIVDCMKVYDNLWDAIDQLKYGTETNDFGKQDWIRRFKQFANNYFNGDIVKTEYCLKDVFMLHKWEKIQNNLKQIDFSEVKQMRELETGDLTAVACVGNGEEGCTI